MKLIYRITRNISITLLGLMAVWAAVFYFVLINEINDETDDALEVYSENILIRALAGEPLPDENNGTNNSYHLREVTPEYAKKTPAINCFDEQVYVLAKGETEPARVRKIIFTDSVNRYFELTVSVPTIEKSELKEAILFWIVFLYVMLLLVTIGINYAILYRSFKPLYQLLDWLDGFNIEHPFSQPDIEIRTTEFARLKDAVVRSSQRNMEAYELQRSFIGNASHELQTPLAVCMSRLEMLSNDDSVSEEQLGEILLTKQSLEYAIRLNKTLLLQTKIENNLFLEQKNIVVNDLVKKLASDYSEIYCESNITVDIVEHGETVVLMNETLATVLLGNLLKNAFVHNYLGGTIDIRIENRGVTIANTGTPTPLDPERIFERFYKMTGREGSTGLGLSLVRSVSRLYGLDIRYQFRGEKHTFEIFFRN